MTPAPGTDGSTHSGGPVADPTAEAPEQAFRIEGEETVWSGRITRVALADMAGPDGRRHRREVVHHPGAVGVLPMHEDGTVTLVHQYRAPVATGMWEIPAGLRDVDGEPPELTARRELIEEVGLDAAELVPLARFHNSPGFSDEAVEVFLATGLTAVAHDRHGPEEEHMVTARVPLSQAVAMVDDGRITDAKTVIAVLQAARAHLRGG